MKKFILGMVSMYMMTAFLFAASISVAGPKAMTLAGDIYYGIVWPAWPISAMTNSVVVPIPDWAFSINGEEDTE